MPHSHPTLAAAVRTWWRESERASALTRLRQLSGIAWEFVRDSLPDRRRQRFGDIDYDWEHRVDTTAANVGWRARLIGLLTSSYQPIEPEIFREMLNALRIHFHGYTFIDIGSGKGRALLMASEWPFERIIGVELLPELNQIAQENIRRFPAERKQCGHIESVRGNATDFEFPSEPLVVFLFHPLTEAAFSQVMHNLKRSLSTNHHPVYIIYANPILEYLILDHGCFEKIGGTYQYSLFVSG